MITDEQVQLILEEIKEIKAALSTEKETMQIALAGIDKRVTLLEQDIKGNGSPGLVDVINDIKKDTAATLEWQRDWSRNDEGGTRAQGCFFKTDQKKVGEAIEERFKARERKYLLIGAIVGLVMVVLTVPGVVHNIRTIKTEEVTNKVLLELISKVDTAIEGRQ